MPDRKGFHQNGHFLRKIRAMGPDLDVRAVPSRDETQNNENERWVKRSAVAATLGRLNTLVGSFPREVCPVSVRRSRRSSAAHAPGVAPLTAAAAALANPRLIQPCRPSCAIVSGVMRV